MRYPLIKGELMSAKLIKLNNGLEIIADESHELPVISLQILVRVGSANELSKEAGIAHVMEHMMFKGTPTRPVGMIASEVEAAGGEINAYTSLDQTVYYLSMASKFWEQGIDILADAVCNSIFDPTELEREKEVILEEIRRGNDDPGHFVGEELFKNLYGAHPYGTPIIGYEKTVKSFDQKMLNEFFEKWYVAENISIIAVGDFDTNKLVSLCEKLFAGRSKKMSAHTTYSKPRIVSNCVVNSKQLFSTHLSLGFTVPEITHPDIPAIDTAAHILGGGRSSRLEQEVKENKGLVHRIYSYALTPKSYGLFYIYSRLLDKNLEKANKAIFDEIHKLGSIGPTTSELERTKQNICADEIYEKETVGGLAGKYAYFRATAGTYDFEKEYYKRLKLVSVDDVKRVVSNYLNPSKVVISMLVPEKSNKKKVGLPKLNKVSQKKIATCAKTKKPFVTKLSGGAKVIVVKDKRLPLTSVYMAVAGGLRSETKANNGISELMARTMVKGTKRLNALELAKEVEGMSSNIEAYGGRNSFGVKGQFLSQNTDRFWPVFMEILSEPAFCANEVKKEKQYLLRSIKDEEDSFSSLAVADVLKKLFPKHPYGMRTLGTKESVSKLNHLSLGKCYNKTLSQKGMVFCVVGDCDVDDVVSTIEKGIVGLPKTKPLNKKLALGEMSKARESLIKKSGREQAFVVMAGRGASISSEDKYPLAVVEQILSGQGGRLFMELRDKQSLAYAVGMNMQLGVECGYYLLYIGTEPSKVDTAISGMNLELKKLSENPIHDCELDRAKMHIVGTYELGRQKQSARSGEYALNTLYGIGIDETDNYPKKIEAVKKADVIRVVKKYLNPKNTVTTIVTPK